MLGLEKVVRDKTPALHFLAPLLPSFIGTLDYSDSLEDSFSFKIATFAISSSFYSTLSWKCAFDLSKFSLQFSELLDTHCKMTVSAGENSTESSSPLATLAPLQAVLFDVDGTLCDSDPLHFYAFREMLLEIGYNGGVPVDEEWYIKTIAGKHNDDIASALFPDDQERGLKFCDDKEAMFRRMVKEQLKPIDGLYKVKKWIEDRGMKRAAVTNAPRLNAELMIEILGLKDFFDLVIIGSECERAKPSPDPYLKAIELLNISKEHTFIFEDSFSGIKAGVAAGMPVVGLATRNPPHILMEAKPAFLIKDYEDSKLWEALEEIDKKTGATTRV